MTSEMREIQHDQHSHPGPRQYVMVGIVLTVLTVFEILLYYMEADWDMIPAGVAAPAILVLSAAKFIIVVMFYMHLKFDSKVFTGIFLFGAALGSLAIVGLILLYHVLPTSFRA